MGVRSYEAREESRPRQRGPSALAAILLAVLVLLGLLANGRPIGGGSPAFLAFAFDATGGALLGKLVASIGCAVAALLVFLAVGRRWPMDDARTAALLFAFGTAVWASAQSFSVTPFSAALVAAAVLLLVLGEDDPAVAPRAGLPLALAAALQPADLAIALILTLAAVIRRPRQIGLWALWSAPGIVVGLVLATTNGSASAFRFDEAWVPRLAALWVSPATGLLVFAPVVLVGLVGLARALRGESAPLAAGCGAAFLAHGLVIAAHPLIGGTWGPRDWTGALPLVFLFLPEGLDVLRGAGTALAVVSVAVQLLGAFAYDGRWDRLFAPTPEKRLAVAWGAAESPIPFQLGERVLVAALPQMHQRRLLVAEHRMVLGAPEGARVSANASRLAVEGADPTFGNVHLLGGARVQGDRIRLESAGDAIFFRVRPESRARQLEVRITGRGQGTLALEEASFWNPEPRLRERSVSGDFRLRFPFHYAESGGGDLRVSLRSGSVDVSSLRLVPPTEPENVIRLSGS